MRERFMGCDVQRDGLVFSRPDPSSPQRSATMREQTLVHEMALSLASDVVRAQLRDNPATPEAELTDMAARAVRAFLAASSVAVSPAGAPAAPAS